MKPALKNSRNHLPLPVWLHLHPTHPVNSDLILERIVQMMDLLVVAYDPTTRDSNPCSNILQYYLFLVQLNEKKKIRAQTQVHSFLCEVS